MKKFASLTVAASLVSVGLFSPALVATADEVAPTTAPTTSTATETLQQRTERVLAGSGISADVQAQIRALVAKLPADTWDRVKTSNAKLGIHETEYSEIAHGAINPNDYQCEASDLQTWLNASLAALDPVSTAILMMLPFDQFATYDALLYVSESKNNTFGINGEYTNMLTSQMKDLRRFWDINGSDIQLVPMHSGDVFSDVDRLARTVALLMGLSPEEAVVQAQAYLDMLALAPGLANGTHPILSFNAFAFDPTGQPGAAELGLKKKILMGDGILQALAGAGVDEKVGPRAILAHEYGHQVQYANGLFTTTLTGPEASRRTELMADAFGTYFLVHSKGAALNAQRTLAGEKASYNVGDCSFASPGHHGTPTQRFNTSAWAAAVVNSAPNQGHQLGGVAFATLFDAKLPELVAPDAE